jgi:hypothetical protein
MGIMDTICIALGSWALGLFTACFLLGWMDERNDTRAGIAWRKDLDTTVNWSTRYPTYRR